MKIIDAQIHLWTKGTVVPPPAPWTSRDRTSIQTLVAKAELQRCAGTQLDPDVVEAFCRLSESEWTAIRAQVVTDEAERTAA